ncbi:hypothetical protein OAK19_06610, partial [Aureispira]|nr:hypothetical protein [Aureispira sp.]
LLVQSSLASGSPSSGSYMSEAGGSIGRIHFEIGSGGCSNTDTLNLTINNSTSNSSTETACDSFTWSVNGQTYTTSGTYTEVSTNAAGCAHTDTLNLTINNLSAVTDVITACDSYTWIDGNTYTASNNTATHTLINAAGCDTVVTLDLTINNSNAGTSSATACDSYDWDGVTYTASGTYTNTYTNASGCDSVHTLALTINNAATGIDVITACDSYTWIDGNTYTASNNTATHTITSAGGCDTVVTLDLTINNSTSNSSTETACDSFTWSVNGQTYAMSGTYTDVSTNAAGCAHTETLNLTINNSTSATSAETACDSYTWAVNGQTYTVSGTYIDVSTNTVGCGHIETLNLTINNSPTASTASTDASSIGASDGTATVTAAGGLIPYTYLWSDGQTTATAVGLAAGTYSVTVTDGNGCTTISSSIVNEPAPVGGPYITAQDGPWSTGSTWVGGVVPPPSGDVTIDHHVTVGLNMTHTGSMTISSNKSVTMAAGSDLSHSGALDNNGSISGSFTLTGSSRAINIGEVENLIVSVTGTVSANANCSISRFLRVDGGATIDVTGYQAMLLADVNGTCLVHDNGGVTLGDFIVEQFIPHAGQPYANVFYSSPVNNATVGEIQDDCNMILGSGANSFYFNEATGQWTAPTSFAHPMANGQGFYQYTYVSSIGKEFDFTGELNTGNISIPISNSGGGGWNIVGNPYPSPIDLKLLWQLGLPNNPAVFYRYNGSSYNTFIAPVEISNPPGLTKYVASMQGMWINAGALTSIDFTNMSRVTDPAQPVDNFTKTTIPLFRLAMAHQTDTLTSAVYFFNA